MSDATDPPEARQTPTAPAPPPRDDIARLLVDAVNAAYAKGIHVLATSEPGVTCISTHAAERWVVAPRVRGVSPVGAAILYVQPRPPEVEVASCVALRVSPAWMMGFVAGVSGEPPYASWQDHVGRLLIHEAYYLGVEFRSFLSMDVCDVHNRYHEKGRPCPTCAEAEEAATPYNPNAGRGLQ